MASVKDSAHLLKDEADSFAEACGANTINCNSEKGHSSRASLSYCTNVLDVTSPIVSFSEIKSEYLETKVVNPLVSSSSMSTAPTRRSSISSSSKCFVPDSSASSKRVADDESMHEQYEESMQEIIDIQENALLDLNTGQIQIVSHPRLGVSDTEASSLYLLVPSSLQGSLGKLETGSGKICISDLLKHESISSGALNLLKSLNVQSDSAVQVLNSNGAPVRLSDILSTVSDSKSNTSESNTKVDASESGSGIIHLATSAVSPAQIYTYDVSGTQHLSGEHINIPSWACHLRDCTLYGDTYMGYVLNEVEMETVLNLYKKETHSLFAIRQTPSPVKDENAETVRLMWKSQYVPYDGIPFINVGRRATVMECEYGPRKRGNAMKRIIQSRGQPESPRKLPNMTCPARLFIKKVRKFPHFSVPLDTDPKVLRQLQEQSLKLVRHSGFNSGELRFYVQLPLPSAHRYHNLAPGVEARSEGEDADEEANQTPADARVISKIQELVRQGLSNPFLVRTSVRDYVEHHMPLRTLEQKPWKFDKRFFLPMIEIQNIIQQTQASIEAGVLSPLPALKDSPVSPRPKRRRALLTSVPSTGGAPARRPKSADGSGNPSALTLPVVVPPGTNTESRSQPSHDSVSTHDGDTISLTISDSQLHSFSIANFTYEQLSQLAKIGLLALNSATFVKDAESVEVPSQHASNAPDAETPASVSGLGTAQAASTNRAIAVCASGSLSNELSFSCSYLPAARKPVDNASLACTSKSDVLQVDVRVEK